MKLYWHKKENSARLLLIFNGWGFDKQVIHDLEISGMDVLLVFNYTTINPEILACTHDYEQVDLVAWSFGVYAANYCALALPCLNQCVAVNGTLIPVSDQYGIPVEIFESTLQTYDDKNQRRFQMRLAGGASAFKAMQKYLPIRDASEQLAELAAMGRLFKTPPAQNLAWNKAIVSNADKIFPPENMCAAWGDLAQVVQGDHYINFNRIIRDFL